MQSNKLIVILGPTASGKTDLSIKLAKKFSGEIVSVDSRQVYRGLNIGSGKITKSQMQGIPHHLLDVANPKRKFTVAQFQKSATKKIRAIQKQNKIPFLVGGTGFYIQSVVDGFVIPEVKPNWSLRRQLKKNSIQELYIMLLKLDKKRAETIDKQNPVRLIRAIEIAKAQKNVPPLIKNPQFEVLQLGINKPKKELHLAIRKRLEKRLKTGMIAEVKKLHTKGLSWKRLEEFGLEYRFVAQHLKGKLTRQEMTEKLQKEIEHFAKRQMTWFKRDKKIHWVASLPAQAGQKEAEGLIKKFLH